MAPTTKLRGRDPESEERSNDEWESRVNTKLGKGQSPVVLGVGLIAEENAVILIIASTFKGGGTKSGKAADAKVHEHLAGASLHHIPGCENCVSTANHPLADCIRIYRGKYGVFWQMEVWVMLEAHFDKLTHKVQWNLHDLCEKGAVKAEGYFCLAEGKKLIGEDGSLRPGLDIAIVKLLGPITGLSATANQPLILSRKEAGHMITYYTRKGAPDVEIMLEGKGAYTSRHIYGQDTNMVRWIKVRKVSWTRTTITGMAARRFGVGILLATWKFPLRYAGQLRIFESYVPEGFSGGGAYASLPARALNPNALANDADIPVLLGNISTWGMFWDHELLPKVIYGQRSCGWLSAMCFLFSSLLDDIMLAVRKDDEDEDAHFLFGPNPRFLRVLVDFLISYIWQDRRNDHFRLEGGGRGDLEVEEIHCTSVAFLTKEGLAQQLTRDYHRF